MLAEFDTNLVDLNHSEFVITVGDFADILIVHPFFKDNWPDYVTHPLQLKEQLAAYHDAANAADVDGGHTNLQARSDRRKEVCESIVLMCQYVVMRSVSEKNPSLLDNLGLKLKTRASRSMKKPKTLAAPTSVTIKHGPGSGTVTVIYNKVNGAGTYEIQMCLGDPNVEASWTVVGQFALCRTPISGQEPGSKIYVRVRCHGTGTPGPFSQVATIIVL